MRRFLESDAAAAEYDQARRYATRQLELDPWREEAHRQVMRVLALRGERGAALAQYETCRRTLDNELGVEPSEETIALYRQIQRGELQKERALAQPAHSDNLPTALTPFVGRTQELSELARLLTDPACRLLTLVGPGGIGKTRLAIQAATQQAETFVQGVAFVPLAPLSSIELIVSAIADALGLALHSSTDPKSQLLNDLREKHVLLVLDNFEHLLDGAELLAELLSQAHQLNVLVTSRESLQLHGEWVFEVKGLAVPVDDRLQEFDGNDATTLFLQRARRAHVGFMVTDAARPAIVRICRLVEGMPLAIELAAAWVRTLSCLEIAQEIERGLDFLNAAARDIPPRHRSLRAVFDHSWHLLSGDERRILRRLAVFRGGFRREAAEQVAGATLSALSSLVAKSLLRRTEAGRYDLHELVRQYARQQLQAIGEEPAIRRQHADYFIRFAESARWELNGPDEVEWFNRLDEEHDNMREVFGWALDPQPNTEASERFTASARLAGVMYHIWFLRGYHAEGIERLKQLLMLPAASERTACRALGDRIGIANSFRELADIALAQGDDIRARQLYAETASLYKDLRDMTQSAYPLRRLAYFTLADGDGIQAAAQFVESLQINRQIGDPRGITASIAGLAAVALGRGEKLQAAHLFGAVEAILVAIVAPLLPTDRREYARNVAALRAQLSEADFAAAWGEGCGMTLDQAVVYALEL